MRNTLTISRSSKLRLLRAKNRTAILRWRCSVSWLHRRKRHFCRHNKTVCSNRIPGQTISGNRSTSLLQISNKINSNRCNSNRRLIKKLTGRISIKTIIGAIRGTGKSKWLLPSRRICPNTIDSQTVNIQQPVDQGWTIASLLSQELVTKLQMAVSSSSLTKGRLFRISTLRKWLKWSVKWN